jgi:molybdopterin converting factor small subunit
MKVRVRLFAAARDAAGCDGLELDLAEPVTVADVRHQLAAVCPRLAHWAPHLLFALDHQYVPDAAVIGPAAELAGFPPVSGG